MGYPRVEDSHLQTHSVVVTKSAIFVYIVLQSMPPAPAETSNLIELPNGSTGARTIPIGDSAGLDITAGSDGRIYLYDGPARNQVFLLDPTTGSMASVQYLTAPVGSFVRAVFV